MINSIIPWYGLKFNYNFRFLPFRTFEGSSSLCVKYYKD